MLAVPLYMIQINYEHILREETPVKAKEIMYQRTSAINYNPNLFIDELLSIIKRVFVLKNTMMNKLFKNDMAN